MAEDQVIKLLEEIRDLQKQHVDSYKSALQHQRQSVLMQRKSVTRHKIVAVAVFVAIALGCAVFFLTTGFASH